tara:strand:+ start:756 stop:1226 length:471 start_codon:yes stop_codon:yes gene_type:complete
MGTTTFSGPVKAGTIKDTTGTTVGTDVNNVGFVLMAQSAVIDIVGASATTTVGVIPANSKITEVSLNIVEASNNASAATVSVGFSGATTALLSGTNAKAIGLTQSTGMATASINTGTLDRTILATYTPIATVAGTLGIADVTVKYLQNANLDITDS